MGTTPARTPAQLDASNRSGCVVPRRPCQGHADDRGRRSRRATPRSPSSGASPISTRSAPARLSRPRSCVSSPRKMSRASTPGPMARSSASSSSASAGSRHGASSSRSASRSIASSSPARSRPSRPRSPATGFETERFFDRIGSQTDPVEIARQAGTRPPFPDLDQIGPAGGDAAPPLTRLPINEPPAYTPPAYTDRRDAHPGRADPTPEPAEADRRLHRGRGADACRAGRTSRYRAAAESVGARSRRAPGPVARKRPPRPRSLTQAEQADAPPIDPNQLVGVMDPEAGHDDQAASGSPWGPGTDAVGEQAPASDRSTMQSSPSRTAGASDGSDEPVSVGAEARVVMPRTTGGAGSWLRWPNSTVDRSVPSH